MQGGGDPPAEIHKGYAPDRSIPFGVPAGGFCGSSCFGQREHHTVPLPCLTLRQRTSETAKYTHHIIAQAISSTSMISGGPLRPVYTVRITQFKAQTIATTPLKSTLRRVAGFLFMSDPLHKKAPVRAALIKQHKNVFGKRRSFGYAVSPFCRSFIKDAGSIPTRS